MLAGDSPNLAMGKAPESWHSIDQIVEMEREGYEAHREEEGRERPKGLGIYLESTC